MTGGGCRRRIVKETSIFRPNNPYSFPLEDADELLFHSSTDLYLLNSPPQCPFPSSNPTHLDFFDNVTDLIQLEKASKRIQQRGNESYIKSLCDRVSALEAGLDRVSKEKMAKKKKKNVKPQQRDRKYSWTAEIKTGDKDGNGIDRKYKWMAEIKSGEEEDDAVKNYKWIAEIRGEGKEAATTRTYTYKASTLASSAHQNVDKKKKNNKDSSSWSPPSGNSTVQIEEHVDPRVLALKHAFAKRGGVADNAKGKKKELSPQDAAMMIQINFRAYLIRRSQALRALRDLAVAKAKLKELRVLFSNFSYRHRIVLDGEERQKFSEKIIILLLTVDAIERPRQACAGEQFFTAFPLAQST